MLHMNLRGLRVARIGSKTRERIGEGGMSWVAWLLGAVALIAMFALWDLIFCDGRRCKELGDRWRE